MIPYEGDTYVLQNRELYIFPATNPLSNKDPLMQILYCSFHPKKQISMNFIIQDVVASGFQYPLTDVRHWQEMWMQETEAWLCIYPSFLFGCASDMACVLQPKLLLGSSLPTFSAFTGCRQQLTRGPLLSPLELQ